MPRKLAVNKKRYWAAELAISLALLPLVALTLTGASLAQGPALTTISDTIYRADGTPAMGTVLIAWPTFQTAEGDPVAAGNLAVTIGAEGAFVVQLVPNVGATPSGTYYTVVLQLDDGTVRTEYWAVPTTSPTNIAGVLTTPGTGLENLAVTQEYVDAAVANLNSMVVHLAGAETISGAKQFIASPSLPAPAVASDAANKGYVDAAVANVGSGAYVQKAGDTMTGPLTLPGDPTAPTQAADRHYVDNGLAVKADLVNGLVPTSELGSGVASAITCLIGNYTWGSCGGGAPAGITYATTALNWTQTVAHSLTGGSQATVTLTPCPGGIDTSSGAGYQVLISGGGNAESVNVVSATGGCSSGAPSGTITFTPFHSYASGYTIGSASSGIQETLNAACGTNPIPSHNSQCNVTIPANGPNETVNTYNVYGTIFVHSNQSVLSGYGTSLNCLGRGACLQLGDLKNSNDFTDNTISGLSFRTPVSVAGNPAFAGVAITQTVRSSLVATITTASPHGFRVGDMVTILFTDSSTYWGDAVVTAVPSSTTFQYASSGSTLAARATPGVVALAYVAILDNAGNSHMTDISYDFAGENGAFNNFFDLWDDENTVIEHFNNQAISLNGNANWTGSFVFSAGNQNHQVAPVITLRDSTITANASNGITDYNNNGLYIENTVLQATGPWQVYSANTTGNYQGAYLKNVYSESGTSLNPLSPPVSPFPGLGIAGLIAGPSSGSAGMQIAGNGGTTGAFQTGGNGSTPYTYYIVANDTTSGTQTSPMQVLNWLSTGRDTIPVSWPRVANETDAITYDVIRMASPVGVGPTPSYPYTGGCIGGSGGACGYVAQGLTQAAACSNGLVCTYTDSGSASTVAYTTNPTLYPLAGTYFGNLIFWPGSIVSVNKSIRVDMEQEDPVGIGLDGSAVQIASQCGSYGAASPGGYTTCLASVTASAGGGIANQSATLLTDGANVGGGQVVTKGRLNFSSTTNSTVGPHHIITLIDSQPAMTQTTWGYRPLASGNDTWIGTDASPFGTTLNAAPLAFGSPVSITNYIGQTGDGAHANWLERLSATLKEFNVPTKFDQSVTLAGLADGCLNLMSGIITSTGTSCGSGGGGSVGSVFGRIGAVVANSGDYTVFQVTGAAVDASVVHNTGNETIAGGKTFTGNVTANANLLLPQGNGYVPAVGGIGLDTGAGLPVVNLAGTTHQIAFTSSNISGQAGTALALAATPTQCSGAFATGIGANGNANCTTPNVIQLSETTQPAGIPNWGVFWFDSATHSPRVIENNGQVTQLGLTNMFNSDPGGDPADNVEERNGATAENLRVYSSYSNNTTWQRTSLGFDATDGAPSGYAVIRSENATTSSAPGLGFWIGSGLKWVIDAAGNLKPWTDNQFNLGSDTGNAAKSVFAKTSFNSVTFGRNDFEIPNDGTTGTVLNGLAAFNSSSPSQAVIAGTGSTNGVVGVVQGGAGKSGNAVITWRGYAFCIFDDATVAGDAVVASTSTAGDCHDTGSGAQPSSQMIGYVDVTNTVSGQTNGMRVSLQPPQMGSVASVFGRSGAVVAAVGDYSVGQVTGAAVDSAVVHVTGVETISGAKTFASDVTLSGNLNVAGNISQTGTGPTQWSGTKWTGTTVTVPSGKDYALGVGSDNTFKCQLASGASCMAGGGGMIYPGAGIGNSTGSAWGTSYGTSGSGSTLALTASPVFTGSPTVPGYVTTGTTVNGHALTANVTVSASDLATGTLPHAQLPALVSGDIPNNSANTTGTAANLSGAPTLPAGTVVAGYVTTGTTVNGHALSANVTVSASDLTTGTLAAAQLPVPACSWITEPTQSGSGNAFTGTNKAVVWGVFNHYPCSTNNVAYVVGTADNTANNYALGLYSGTSGGTGTLIATTASTAGTTFASATGIKHIGWSASNVIVPAGRVYIALTSNCASACAALLGTPGSGVTWAANLQVSVTTGGAALPATITLPADSFSSGASIPALVVY